MKKFTKICLTTALVLFLIGLILCIVCWFLGGFRQLHNMGNLYSIPFVSYLDDRGVWRDGVWRYGLEDLEDIEDIEEVRRVVNQELEQWLKGLEGEKEQLALTADTLRSLEIDVTDCNVVVMESEDANAWFLVDGNSNRPHYSIENSGGRSELTIENEVEHHIGHWRKGPNDTVCLWLPKGCTLEECEISIGAGYAGTGFLKSDQVNVTVGAGMFELAGFEGKEIKIQVGAGELLAGSVTAETAKFEVGAGHLGIERLSVSREADLDVSMGECEIAGTITGDLDLECDMGETVMSLTGSENDHSYDVECGMGSVTVGSYSHGGFAAEKSWNSGKNSEFDIDCNMGNVTVTFEK